MTKRRVASPCNCWRPPFDERCRSSRTRTTIVLTTLFAVLGVAIGTAPPKNSPLLAASASLSQPAPLQTKSVNIEDVQVGDFVLAKDPITGEVAQRKVLQAFNRVSNHLRILTLVSDAGETQTLSTTDEHPFFVAGNVEVKAGELAHG